MAEHSDPPHRGRGERAGLDRDRILEAARGIAPANLTMKAVADLLGVDRKAVNYHVSDLDTLLELVAGHAFADGFAAFAIDGELSWQEACRSFATITLESLLATGELSAHFRYEGGASVEVLRPAEAVLEKLVAAGFAEREASRALSLLLNVAIAHARDVIVSARFGEHPQLSELRTALADSDAAGYDVVRRIMQRGSPAYDSTQFAFYLDVTIAGLEKALA